MMATKATGPRKKAADPVSQFETGCKKAGITHEVGKQAVEAAYSSHIDAINGKFTHSVDLDKHFKPSEPESPRWDYGLGVRFSNGVEVAVWIEPHPASSTGEVNSMLAKLGWLKKKLDSPSFSELRDLRDAAGRLGVNPYRWQVTQTGDNRITAQSKEARMLAKAGLEMPSRHIKLKLK
ncbi:hypothetical protein [Telluria aromaticivorans]|uniref:Uncharacterized protein n=1 Tax=Telluria aromaticivorans TaxID=2725995 RepID=A0A7Y2P033_9BURK|nr:hypothetical protein [Telluria aromaticivorans]NNG23141.1 hypothetical protein [Telluria aromaticivorans]